MEILLKIRIANSPKIDAISLIVSRIEQITLNRERRKMRLVNYRIKMNETFKFNNPIKNLRKKLKSRRSVKLRVLRIIESTMKISPKRLRL